VTLFTDIKSDMLLTALNHLRWGRLRLKWTVQYLFSLDSNKPRLLTVHVDRQLIPNSRSSSGEGIRCKWSRSWGL